MPSYCMNILIAVYFFIFLIGAVIGNFLNVVIDRLPKKESIVFSKSHCPSCGFYLKWWHLIPIVSYIIQRGRCANCGISISCRYFLIETVTGLLFMTIFNYFGLSWLTLTYWFLVSCLIIISIIDWNHFIIPDSLNLMILLVGLITSLTGITLPFIEGLSGSLLGGGILLALAILSKGGMGGGDVKFVFAIGFFTGWQGMLLLIFLASLLGSIFGLCKIFMQGKDKGRMIPFGPFLATVTFLNVIWGEQLIHFYLGFF